MAMASIGEALLAASVFLGLGASRGDARASDLSTARRDEPDATRSPPADGSPTSDDPWFQAVAEALVEAGYLPS